MPHPVGLFIFSFPFLPNCHRSWLLNFQPLPVFHGSSPCLLILFLLSLFISLSLPPLLPRHFALPSVFSPVLVFRWCTYFFHFFDILYWRSLSKFLTWHNDGSSQWPLRQVAYMLQQVDPVEIQPEEWRVQQSWISLRFPVGKTKFWIRKEYTYNTLAFGRN